MNIFPLNENWSVEYFEPNIDGFEMAPSPQPVQRLSDWVCSGRFATAGFYAYLRREFEITAVTDRCVRYAIQVENAPPATRVYVNDVYLGDAAGHSTRIDITDNISLGRNKLNLRVSCWQGGAARFDDLYLVQADCDHA